MHTGMQVTAELLGTEVGFSHHSSKGVDWVFVEHPSYLRPGLYGDENGVYGDNQVSARYLSLFPNMPLVSISVNNEETCQLMAGQLPSITAQLTSSPMQL